MRHSMSQSDLRIIQHESDVAARRLIRQLRLPYDDLADFRQELVLDVIARLPAFDPKRGSLGAFVGILMRNKARRLADAVRRERRLHGAVPISLSEALHDGDCVACSDFISE